MYIPYIEATITNCEEDLEGADITLQIGMDISGTTEWITIGKYTVSDINISDLEVSFTAVGYLNSKCGNVTSVTIPAGTSVTNAISLIREACHLSITMIGVTASGTVEAGFTATARDAIGAIALQLGCFVSENNNGGIVLAKLMAGSELSLSDERCVDPPEYAEANVTEEGYTFRPGRINLTLGDPRLEPWDYLTVTDGPYTLPCLRITHTFDGGLQTIIDCTRPSDTSGNTEVIKGAIETKLGNLEYLVEEVKETAEGADDKATRALTSADGKSTIYYGPSQPTGGTYQVGDTWFNESEDNAIYTYNGSTWVKKEFGEDAIANLAITNAKIADGTIQNAKIANLDAGKITTGTLSTNVLNVTEIISTGGIATDSEVSAAKNEAISTASADATSKGNEARLYADNYLAYTPSAGVTLGYSGLQSKVNIKGDGIRIYDGNGNNNAFFGTDSGNPSIRIGNTDQRGHLRIDSTYGVRFLRDDDSTRMAQVASDGMQIWQYDSDTSTNTSVAFFGAASRVGATSVDGNIVINTSDGMSIYNAGQTSSYARFNSSGVRIGPTSSKHVYVTSSGINFYNADTSIANFTPTMLRLGLSGGARVVLQNDVYHGLEVFDENNDSVAWLGSAARLGKNNSSRFVMGANSLQAYNSSNVKYFEVSASGITYGTNTVANISDIPTKVSELTNDSSFATTSQVSTAKSDAISTASADATSKANDAEANAKKEATNYLYYSSSAGLNIAQSSPSTATKKVHIHSTGIKIQQSADNYANVTSDGLIVYKGGQQVGYFGSTARVGSPNDGNIYIGSSGMNVYKKDSTDTDPVSIAFFGSSNSKGYARIGNLNEGNHIEIDPDSGFRVYDASSNEYFRARDGLVRVGTNNSGDRWTTISANGVGVLKDNGDDTQTRKVYLGYDVNEGDYVIKCSGLIYAENHSSAIGWYDAHYNTTSLSNATTFTTISGSSITLSAGRYILTASASFGGNATGVRGIAFYSGSSAVTEGSEVIPTISNANWATRLSISMIRNVESSETISLSYVQSSGSDLSTTWFIKAIRIR